ncbi:hypothetical protein C5167_017478 [Papaver somniferum]|uniref:Uncharacterized protein n=1 Tax=Papaver somniferum TaxID=3469 RepID=A0A4Y7INM8_PAPSO|nr:hypothetical protein C5167_017478 [Papaver somniferum]
MVLHIFISLVNSLIYRQIARSYYLNTKYDELRSCLIPSSNGEGASYHPFRDDCNLGKYISWATDQGG